MRDILDLLEQRHPGGRELVLERFPAQSRAHLESRTGSSWLPVEHGHHAVEGIFDILGEEEGVAFFREAFGSLVRRSVFQGFFGPLLRLWSGNRGKLFSAIPRGWELGFRDFCQVRLEVAEPGHVRLRFEDVAPVVREHPAYLLCWRGILGGVIDLSGLDARLDFQVAPDRSHATADFHWES